MANMISAKTLSLGLVLATVGAASAEAQASTRAIAAKYSGTFGGATGALGSATSKELPAGPQGRYQCYEHGAIAWHPDHGAFGMTGTIYTQTVFYRMCQGIAEDVDRELLNLLPSVGFPTSDEHDSPGKWECPEGNRLQTFVDWFGESGLCRSGDEVFAVDDGVFPE